MNIERRVLSVKKTRRAIRAEEKTAARRRLVEQDAKLIADGTAERLLVERGIDILNHSCPVGGAADGGSGRDDEGPLDTRSTSESMSDWIRGRIEMGREQREKVKRLPNSIPDARLIPDDPNQGSFEDRNLWS